MRRNKYGRLIEEWEVGMITARAKRYGFREDEIPDLEQQIVPELLKTDFKPGLRGGAEETTFVIGIIDRHLKKILRDRYRNVRRANYEIVPINVEDVVTQHSFFKMRETERLHLRIDLETAMAGLSADEREICKGLMRGETQTNIARSMKKSKAALSEVVKHKQEVG